MLRIVFCIFLSIFATECFSKEITISGVATDSSGAALAYTDILLKGSNLKIMSDAEGHFRVKVRRMQKITFLWCNYRPVHTRLMKSYNNMRIEMSVKKSKIIKK